MTRPPARHRLLVFAKAPVAGQVKTRLQPEVTPIQSAAIHRVLVEHTLDTACAMDSLTIELWVSEWHCWWQRLEKKYNLAVFQQRGESLGDRMSHALTDALSRSDSVLIIGTDCPYITHNYLLQAINRLADSSVVLGPAEDGGYVLIGSNNACPDIFADVDWGSHQVLQQTRKNLQRANISWLELESLSDIDRVEDLQRLNILMPKLLGNLISSHSSSI